jgi:hypothetical protein
MRCESPTEERGPFLDPSFVEHSGAPNLISLVEEKFTMLVSEESYNICPEF